MKEPAWIERYKREIDELRAGFAEHENQYAALREDHDALVKIMDELNVLPNTKRANKVAKPNGSPKAGLPEFGARILPPKTDAIAYNLCKYARRGQASVPVLLIGGQGSGKTRGARQMARYQGFAESEIIEVGGHRGLEACDLLGHLILSGGDTLWKDGAITQAFRQVGCTNPGQLPETAERNEREKIAVFLLIDELYRIPVRDREILLNALQPDTINGVNCYKLRTGRAVSGKDGAYQEEVIYAPCQFVSIVGTTNVGIEFDVEEGCAAAKERFVSVYVEIDDMTFGGVIDRALKERGFSVEVTPRFVKLRRSLDNAKKDRTLNGSLTLRTAVRAIENALYPKDLGNTLFEIGQIWIEPAEDGAPLNEQVEVLKTAITAAGFTLEKDAC